MWPPILQHDLPSRPVGQILVPNPSPSLAPALEQSATYYVPLFSHNVALPANVYYPAPLSPPLAPHPDVRQKRQRQSKPKVRTGCRTCKIRRIKCDETKPDCIKCTSTGRKCDGYEFPKKGKDDSSSAGSVTAPVRPHGSKFLLPTALSLAYQDASHHERRIFHRFQVCTIPVLAGGSETGFWYSIVVKVGLQEPIIRDAIIALGTLHEDYESRKGMWDRDIIKQPAHQHALHLYGKALRQLNQKLNEPTRANAKIAIVASILFTCFEVMRRNNMAAVIHYSQGMRQLMRQMNLPEGGDSASAVTTTKKSFSKPAVGDTPQTELDEMLRVFARYDVQACTFSKETIEPITIQLKSEIPSDLTLATVRYHLDNLLMSVYQIIRSDVRMYRYWSREAVPEQWRRQIQDGIEVFEAWVAALEDFFHKNQFTLNAIETKSLLGLRLQVKVAIIMLKTCVDSGPEQTFDGFHDEFEEIVKQVEVMTDGLQLDEVAPLGADNIPFTMDLGIVHPLFFVACKSRDRLLRRRAIKQLRKAGKEGIWEGSVIALLAEWVVYTEERGIPTDQPIPERNRIHDVRKNVDYPTRRILLEAKMARDAKFENWKVIRWMIPF